jgi:hypothetical protein
VLTYNHSLQPTILNDNVNELESDKSYFTLKVKTMTLMSHFFARNSTGCLKIREFRIQSVVGDHFSSPNMEIKKKKSELPHKDTLV